MLGAAVGVRGVRTRGEERRRAAAAQTHDPSGRIHLLFVNR